MYCPKPSMEESQGLRPDWKGAERIAVRQWRGWGAPEPWKAVLRLRFVCKKCSPQKEKLPSKRAKNKIVLENFLKKVYNFLKNEHSTIYAGRHT